MDTNTDVKVMTEEELMNQHDDQREKRKKEWGAQNDLWLIRAASSKSNVRFFLSRGIPGLTDKQNSLEGLPLRVDAFSVQILVKGRTPWIYKNFIVAVEKIDEVDKENGQEVEEKVNSTASRKRVVKKASESES